MDISTKEANVHTPSSTMTKAANNAARGWEGVTLEGMTKNGDQAAMGKLSRSTRTLVMAMLWTITRGSEFNASWRLP